MSDKTLDRLFWAALGLGSIIVVRFVYLLVVNVIIPIIQIEITMRHIDHTLHP